MLEEEKEKYEREYADEAQKKIERARQLEALMSFNEFKNIILDKYFKVTVEECVLSLGDINLSEEKRLQYMDKIKGIGFLKAFFEDIKSEGERAKQYLDQVIALNNQNSLRG